MRQRPFPPGGLGSPFYPGQSCFILLHQVWGLWRVGGIKAALVAESPRHALAHADLANREQMDCRMFRGACDRKDLACVQLG